MGRSQGEPTPDKAHMPREVEMLAFLTPTQKGKPTLWCNRLGRTSQA
jgi:hypothetical protein